MLVRIFGTLRQFAGGKTIEVDLEPGDTVQSLLRKATTRYSDLGEKVFDEEGNLRSSIHVLVNGRSTRYLNGLESRVEEGDKVALFPAVGGG